MAFFNLVIANIISKDLPENEQLIRTMMKEMPIYMLFTNSSSTLQKKHSRKSLKDIFQKKIYIIISGILFGFAHNI